MKDTVIFDIDGTLADCSHRLHHIKKKVKPGQEVTLRGGHKAVVAGPHGDDDVLVRLIGGVADAAEGAGGAFPVQPREIKELQPDWDAFHAACGDDQPIKALCDMAWRYWMTGRRVLLVTGRPEAYRQQTVHWLEWHVGVGAQMRGFELRMRPGGDFRPDHEVKAELVSDEELARTLFIVEDRQQVVDMWRRRGALVLQCAPGDF